MKLLDYNRMRAEIKSGASGGYLFCGEEAYLLRHSLAALKKSLFGDTGDEAFNHVKIDAADGEPDLDGEICQLPVFADKRLVEVWGLDLAHMKADDLRALCGSLALLEENPQTVLVICCSEYELDTSGLPKKPSKQITQLAGFVTPVVFSRETPSALAKWASAHFAHEKIAADNAAVRALIDRVGCDMYTLSGEIAKLCAYAASTGKNAVTAEDVETMCPDVAQIGAFDFSNAVLEGNFRRAMYILSDMKSRREEPVVILAEILRGYARIESVYALTSDGLSTSETAKKLKMSEYPVRKHAEAASRLGPDRISRAIELCTEADHKMKFSSIDRFVIISRLLAELAAL